MHSNLFSRKIKNSISIAQPIKKNIFKPSCNCKQAICSNMIIHNRIEYEKFKDKVDFMKTIISDKKYFNISNINNKNIEDCKISIVMCSSNRSKQTYFTLKTISDSSVKDIHIILVDDSDNDKILISELEKFNLNIDFIEINKKTKCWINPCVNYNIGFQYIKCEKIILQNAEVCHVGDICKYTDLNNNDSYTVFDVKTSGNFHENDLIYSSDMSTEFLHKLLGKNRWYQHYEKNNYNYHFLTSFSRKTFEKLNGFSLEYFSQGAYDDNDFILKIKSLNIPFINIKSDVENLLGIHQYHIFADDSWVKDISLNQHIFSYKQEIYEKTGKFIDY